MSQADVWETYQLRTAVEGFCALHLAHRKETDQGAALLDALEASVARMEAQGEQTDLEEYWAEDFAFHRLLVEFSGNQEFLQLFESYHYRMSVIAKESFHSPNRRAVAREEHQAIVDAIRRSSGRDDLEAYAAVRRHMEASRDLVLREVQAE